MDKLVRYDVKQIYIVLDGKNNNNNNSNNIHDELGGVFAGRASHVLTPLYVITFVCTTQYLNINVSYYIVLLTKSINYRLVNINHH